MQLPCVGTTVLAIPVHNSAPPQGACLITSFCACRVVLTDHWNYYEQNHIKLGGRYYEFKTKVCYLILNKLCFELDEYCVWCEVRHRSLPAQVCDFLRFQGICSIITVTVFGMLNVWLRNLFRVRTALTNQLSNAS